MHCVVLPALDCLEDNNIACIHSKIFRSRLDIGDPTAFADCRFGCTCDLERQIIRRASRLLSLTFIPSGYLSTLPQSVFAHVISAHSRSRSAHLHVAYGPYLPRNSVHMFSLFAHAFHSCVFFSFLQFAPSRSRMEFWKREFLLTFVLKSAHHEHPCIMM